MHYTAGALDFDTDRYALTRNGLPVDVEPQVYDLLVYLIEHRARLVSRDELYAELWNGRVVSDSALTSRLKAARKAVGDDGSRQEIIRTIHGRGYQFVAEVHENMPRDRESIGGAPAAASAFGRKPSIVVLPLVNLSGDPDVLTDYGFYLGFSGRAISELSDRDPDSSIARWTLPDRIPYQDAADTERLRHHLALAGMAR